MLLKINKGNPSPIPKGDTIIFLDNSLKFNLNDVFIFEVIPGKRYRLVVTEVNNKIYDRFFTNLDEAKNEFSKAFKPSFSSSTISAKWCELYDNDADILRMVLKSLGIKKLDES
jgi:hypothetical protein